MDIQVKHFISQGIVNLRVEPEDTIRTVKSKIEEWDGTPLRLQKYVFGGKCLEDERSLEDYGVSSGSTINMIVLKEKHEVQIFVKLMTGKTLTFELELSDAVARLKLMIQDAEGIPPNQQNLIFNQTQLEDHKTLAEYGIRAESTIHLADQLRGGGPSFLFNSMDNPETKGFSSEAPPYRVIAPGINFEGKCTNSECSAFRNLAWAQKRFGTFNIGRVVHDCYCPLCSIQLKEVKNTAMFLCRWNFNGALGTGEKKEGSGSATDGQNFVYFGDGEDQDWSYLEIEVYPI